MALTLCEIGDKATASKFYVEILSRKRGNNDRWAVLNLLYDLADTTENPDLAQQCLKESLALSEALRADWHTTAIRASLAERFGVVGESSAAVSPKGLDSSNRKIGTSYLALGTLAANQGDYPAAMDLFADALGLFSEATDMAYRAIASECLGSTAFRQHDDRAAREFFFAALRARQSLNDADGIRFCESFLR